MTDYETRKRLISRYVWSFEAELEDDDCKKVYDERFLLRMGRETAREGRLFETAVAVMIVIDALIFLILSGHSVKVEILGNKVSGVPGAVEIGLLVASFAYLTGTISFINKEIYKELMESLIKHRNNKCNPEFYMGSLTSTSYVGSIIETRKSVLKPSILHRFVTLLMYFMLISLFLCIYGLHIFIVHIGIRHIFESNIFGSTATQLIYIVLLITNLSALLLFFMVYLYPFKFRASL